MPTDEKLDKIIEDLATIKVQVSYHTKELQEMSDKMVPVLYHINGVRWVMRISAGIIGVLSCLAAVLALLK